jgi:hypothetical protein
MGVQSIPKLSLLKGIKEETMSRPTCRSRRWSSALLAAAALLLCTLSQATCEIRVPGVSVNLDERVFQLAAPGVTMNLQPGRFEINGSPVRYDFGQ